MILAVNDYLNARVCQCFQRFLSFFNHFSTNVFSLFRKLVVIHLVLAIKTQTIHQMKDIVHGSLLVESIFEITYEKVEKSVYENPIF